LLQPVLISELFIKQFMFISPKPQGRRLRQLL